MIGDGSEGSSRQGQTGNSLRVRLHNQEDPGQPTEELLCSVPVGKTILSSDFRISSNMQVLIRSPVCQWIPGSTPTLVGTLVSWELLFAASVRTSLYSSMRREVCLEQLVLHGRF